MGPQSKEKTKNLRDQSGQAIIEYILILLFAMGGAILVTRGVLGALDDGIRRFGGQLEKDLKSGRAPLSVYKN